MTFIASGPVYQFSSILFIIFLLFCHWSSPSVRKNQISSSHPQSFLLIYVQQQASELSSMCVCAVIGLSTGHVHVQYGCNEKIGMGTSKIWLTGHEWLGLGTGNGCIGLEIGSMDINLHVLCVDGGGSGTWFTDTLGAFGCVWQYTSITMDTPITITPDN